MIPLVPTTEQAAAPSTGWSVSTLLRDLVQAWIAHHQRLADSGVSGDL